MTLASQSVGGIGSPGLTVSPSTVCTDSTSSQPSQCQRRRKIATVASELLLIREVKRDIVHIRRSRRNWLESVRSICRDKPFRTLTGTLPDGRDSGTLEEVTCRECKRRFEEGAIRRLEQLRDSA